MSEPVNAFAPATEQLRALRDRQVSAVELFDLHIRRIERLDGPINAIVTRDFERARQAAHAADAARARGEDRPLLGLPITIKDNIDVQGLPTTIGLPERADHRAATDAPLAARARAAGAVIMGKTNLPPYTSDWQAENPIFGRTNNPWNLERTPGGSTGGGGAALAAGLTSLEFGTDIGGSIRIPASWCGVYGHRPSFTAIPRSGHFPGWALPNPAVNLSTLGPLARSASDLELALDVVSGPETGEEVAWRLEIPPARHAALADYRVAILPSVTWLPVGQTFMAAIERLREHLARTGVRVAEAQPDGFGDRVEYHDVYLSLLGPTLGATPRTPDERRNRAAEIRASGVPFAEARARGVEASAADFIDGHARREQYRAAWRDFFRSWDILLAPIVSTPAPPYSTVPLGQRLLDVDGTPVDAFRLLAHPGLAVLAGLPATAFPLGLTPDGLPIGIQAVGPYLEDRTPIRFAGLVAQELGGYQRPPGYDDDRVTRATGA
ncbi:MAG: amidase [Chloroflexota bacterium]